MNTKLLLLITLSFILFTFNAFSQKIKTGTIDHPILGNIKLKKEFGEYEYTDDEKKAYYFFVGKGSYIHKKHGKVDYEILYNDDGTLDVWRDVYQDSIYGEVIVDKRKRNKIKTYFDKENRKIEKITTYHYFDSTEVKDIRNSIDGYRDGKQYLYYQDGTLRKEETYVHGKQVGPYKDFYNNGQVKEEGTFDANNQLNGKFRAYKKNGVAFVDGTYTNGKMLGKWTFSQPSDDLHFEFRSSCIYKKDSAYCEEKKFYVADNSNDLRAITSYKKLIDRDTYSPYETFDELLHTKHGPYKAYYENVLIEEGNYKNNEKEGNWKTYHHNGNLKLDANYMIIVNKEGDRPKSVLHGLKKSYKKDGTLENTIKFYKGNLVDYTPLDTLSIVGGLVLILAIAMLIIYNKKLLNSKTEGSKKLRVTPLIIGACLIILYASNINFLENTFHSFFNTSFGWTEIVSGLSLSVLLSLTILVSLTTKPTIKQTLIGFIGFIIVWILSAFLGITASGLIAYLLDLAFPIHDQNILRGTIALSTACFFGLLFISKYWKIKNQINYVYLFFASLVINLIVYLIIAYPLVKDILSFSDEINILFLLNYLIAAGILSLNAINNFKYAKKIKSAFVIFLTCVLTFSILLFIYKYIDPFTK